MEPDGTEPGAVDDERGRGRRTGLVSRPEAGRVPQRAGRQRRDLRHERGRERPDEVTNHPATDRNPTWSPDGTRLAFESFRDGNREVYVMNVDGSNVRRLTTDPALDFDPAWSPDGGRIAFASNRDDDNYEIYVMNADGTAQTRLTNDPVVEYNPAWSPDGRRIAFHSFRGPPAQYQNLYTMNPDGSGVSRITQTQRNDWNPAWAPDGGHLVFQSDRDAVVEQVYIIDVDSKEQTKLTTGEARTSFRTGRRARGARVLPDPEAMHTVGVKRERRDLDCPPRGGARARPRLGGSDGRDLDPRPRRRGTPGAHDAARPPACERIPRGGRRSLHVRARHPLGDRQARGGRARHRGGRRVGGPAVALGRRLRPLGAEPAKAAGDRPRAGRRLALPARCVAAAEDAVERRSLGVPRPRRTPAHSSPRSSRASSRGASARSRARQPSARSSFSASAYAWASPRRRSRSPGSGLRSATGST